MKKFLCLLVVCVMVVASSLAMAEPITIEVKFKVEMVDDLQNLLGGAVQAGDILTAEYTYESTTPDSNSLPTVGDYRYNTSPYGITVKSGNLTFQTNPANVDFLVEIINDNGTPTRDGYFVLSKNNLPVNNLVVDHISWQLDDPTATANTSEALPTDAPILTDWQSIFGLSITGHPVNNPGYDFFFIRAHAISAKKANVLTITPPSGTYVNTQRFDLVLIAETNEPDVSVTDVNLNGKNVTLPFNKCAHEGVTANGKTFRCPGLSGEFLGVGTNYLTATVTLGSGTQLSEKVTWEVKENKEP